MLVFVNRSAFAQTVAAGTIEGRVADPTGAVIPGATVQVIQRETGVTTTVQTDDLGRYFVPSLKVGEYAITVTQKGFKTTRREGLILQVNQILEINFSLEIGAVTEQVTVTGAAPLIQAADATIGQVIDNKQTTTLPLNGRSYAQLAFLTPTVVPGRGCCPGAFAPTFATTGDFSIGGSRGEDNQFTVDGLSATNDFVGGTYVYPSIDALQEFKITQNSYMPELGSRAGQVLVVSKTGTNKLHGSVYEFLRNDALDARDTFAISKQPLRLNQFGGTAGGPIIKDKTFWFFGYEGTRQRRGTTATTVVPDAAMRSGNFSELLPGVQLHAPVDYPGAGLKAGDPIPGNRIDNLGAANPGAINPIALNVINLAGYPLPNRSGNLYTISPSAPLDQNYYQARIDHNISEKDRLWGSWFYEIQTSTSAPFTTLPKERAESNDHVEQIGLTWNHIFRPNLMNELRLGYNHNIPRSTNGADPKITGLTQQDLGFPLNNFQPILGQRGITAGIPNFSITGYGQAGATGFGGPNVFRTRHMELADTLNYQRGRHRVTFGIDILRDHQDQRFDPLARGIYSFSGQYSRDGFADFLLGFPSSTFREINFTGQEILESLDRETQYSGFAQDGWQINPNFTLNFGLRYDYFGPPSEVQGRVANFIPRGDHIIRVEGRGGRGGSLSSSGQSLGTQGFDIKSGCLCTKQRKDFAPRLSLAYRPFGSDRTVIRAGAGIFFTRVTYNEQESIRFNPPWVFRTLFVNNVPVPSFNMTNGFQTGLAPQSYGGFATDADLKDITLQQWSVEIQQQVTSSLMASISYVGSQMYHGDNNPPLNQAVPGPGPLQTRRPYSGFVTPQDDPAPPDPHYLVYSWGNFGATANYNALTLLVRKQYSQGLTLLAHFTWSKTIDSSSSIIGQSQDPYNLKADRGLASFHVPRRLVASWIYELPFGVGKHFGGGSKGVLNHLIGGWQVTGILGMEDGYYVTPGDSNNTTFTDGFTSLRPNRVCDGHISNGTRDKWFDTSCFVAPPLYAWGTAGRNTVQVPGDVTFDTSILKHFNITESQRLEFRAEFFNAFNRTNLDAPVTDVASGSVGRIFGTNGTALPGSREIQFALKYIF